MSKTLSTRAIFSIAKTYGPSIVMTAVSNADEGGATLASGHNVVVGDYLEIASGWSLLNKKVVRVKDVTTNDVTLEGESTDDLSKNPAGAGAGSVRRITAWENLTQIKDVSTSGATSNLLMPPPWMT